MTNHYETLGVARNATPEMVKAGFQAKMKALEESGMKEPARAAREKAFQQAFVALFNPATKAKYDKQLAMAAAVQPAPPPQAARKNPLVIVVGIAAIAGAVAGGWYMKHPSAEKQAEQRKEAAARNRAARQRLETGVPNANPNPFRNAPDSEIKDRIMKQAIERESKKP